MGAPDTETPTLPPPGWHRARDSSGSRDQGLVAKDCLPSVTYCKDQSQSPQGQDFRGPEKVAAGRNNMKKVHEDSPILDSLKGSPARWAHSPHCLSLCPAGKGPS